MRWLLVLLLCSVAQAETLTLAAGWNSVGFRVQKLEAVSGGTALAIWDGSRYVVFEVTAAALNAGEGGRRGCWIYSAAGGELTYSGSADGRGDYVQLTSGWNLVAFPGAGEVPGGSVTGGQVLCYGTSGEQVNLSSGGRLRPGRAYWMYSPSGGRLSWPSPTATWAWSERPATVLPGLVSSTTLVTPTGLRLYYFIPGEFVSRTSTDGLTFSEQVGTGLRSAPGTQRDRIKEFSVIRLASGQFLMIYEAVDRQNVSRFFRATSTDGISFQGGPDPVLQAEGAENGFISAPDIVEYAGVLYLYYVADGSKTFVASSSDAGQTWTRRGEVSIRGFTGNLTDPDLVVLPDGRLAFFALHNGRGLGMTQAVILAATTRDPFTFDFDSIVVSSSMPTSLKVNPDVVVLPGGRLLMFYAITRDNEQSFDLYRADIL